MKSLLVLSLFVASASLFAQTTAPAAAGTATTTMPAASAPAVEVKGTPSNLDANREIKKSKHSAKKHKAVKHAKKKHKKKHQM